MVIGHEVVTVWTARVRAIIPVCGRVEFGAHNQDNGDKCHGVGYSLQIQ